jgi:hypothetical protein
MMRSVPRSRRARWFASSTQVLGLAANPTNDGFPPWNLPTLVSLPTTFVIVDLAPTSPISSVRVLDLECSLVDVTLPTISSASQSPSLSLTASLTGLMAVSLSDNVSPSNLAGTPTGVLAWTGSSTPAAADNITGTLDPTAVTGALAGAISRPNSQCITLGFGLYVAQWDSTNSWWTLLDPLSPVDAYRPDFLRLFVDSYVPTLGFSTGYAARKWCFSLDEPLRLVPGQALVLTISPANALLLPPAPTATLLPFIRARIESELL